MNFVFLVDQQAELPEITEDKEQPNFSTEVDSQIHRLGEDSSTWMQSKLDFKQQANIHTESTD